MMSWGSGVLRVSSRRLLSSSGSFPSNSQELQRADVLPLNVRTRMQGVVGARSSTPPATRLAGVRRLRIATVFCKHAIRVGLLEGCAHVQGQTLMQPCAPAPVAPIDGQQVELADIKSSTTPNARSRSPRAAATTFLYYVRSYVT
jgi:hypothetical protein